MIAYRVYRVDQSGHIQTVPNIIDCEDDDAARIKAQRFVDGCGTGQDGRTTREFPYGQEVRPPHLRRAQARRHARQWSRCGHR